MSRDVKTENNVRMERLEAAADQEYKLQEDDITVDNIIFHMVFISAGKCRAFLPKRFGKSFPQGYVELNLFQILLQNFHKFRNSRLKKRDWRTEKNVQVDKK